MTTATTVTFEDLEEIVTAAPPQRDGLINDLIARQMGEFKAIARRLCRDNRLDPSQHIDDVLQIVATEAFEMLTKLVSNPKKLNGVTSFMGLVRHHAKAPVKTYVDGPGAGLKPSGAVAHTRRYRETVRTRNVLRVELGREPTDDEVIEETNDRMYRLRKDPARQSMLVSRADLRPPSVTPDDEDATGHTGDEADDVVDRDTAATIVTRVQAEVRDTDPIMAATIEAWLGELSKPDGEGVRDVNEVSRIVGITPAQAAQAIAGVKVIAARIYTEEYAAQTRRGTPCPGGGSA